MDESKRVTDQIKRKGDFDKYRQEILSKVIESECMQRCLEKCQRLVDESLRNAPKNAGIGELRDTIKEKIHRQTVTGELFHHNEKLIHEHLRSAQFNETVENAVRIELGLPIESNLEQVDMEISTSDSIGACSSSKSSKSSTSTKSSPSTARSQKSSSMSISASAASNAAIESGCKLKAGASLDTNQS